MAWRIVVGLKENVRDARGERVRREIREHLGIEFNRCERLTFIPSTRNFQKLRLPLLPRAVQ